MGGVNTDTPPSLAHRSGQPSRRMAAAKLAVPDSEYSRESSSEAIQEHLYKVLVIGDFGVGKLLNALFTSIIANYWWRLAPMGVHVCK